MLSHSTPSDRSTRWTWRKISTMWAMNAVGVGSRPRQLVIAGTVVGSRPGIGENSTSGHALGGTA
jgi:hypothetical protein